MNRDEFRAALRASLNQGKSTDDVPAEQLAVEVEELAARILMLGDGLDGEETGDVIGPLRRKYGLSTAQAMELCTWAEKLANNQRGRT